MNNSFLGKYTPIIIPIILLIVLVVLLIFVLKPGIDNLRKKSDDNQRKLIELDIEKSKISDLPALKNQFSKIETHKNKLDVLFSQDDIIILVQAIERLAEETGNEIAITIEEENDGLRKVKSPKADKDETMEKLLVDFSAEEYFMLDIDVKGDYSQLLNFINRFNELKYYNSLIKFAITPLEEDKHSKSSAVSEDTKNNNENLKDNNTKLNSKITVVFYLNQ